MTKTNKPKRLTIKQAKFVKAKAEGKTGVQAAQIAYDVTDYGTANTIAVENMQKHSIQQALQIEMRKQGIDLPSIVKPIKDGLTAEKVSIVGNGDQAMAEVTPDHHIRIKSAQIASKWMGIDAVDPNGNTFNFVQINNEMKDKYV